MDPLEIGFWIAAVIGACVCGVEEAAGGWTFHRWFFKESSGSADPGTNRVWFVASHT
jgi:hypothetical protein